MNLLTVKSTLFFSRGTQTESRSAWRPGDSDNLVVALVAWNIATSMYINSSAEHVSVSRSGSAPCICRTWRCSHSTMPSLSPKKAPSDSAASAPLTLGFARLQVCIGTGIQFLQDVRALPSWGEYQCHIEPVFANVLHNRRAVVQGTTNLAPADFGTDAWVS